MDNNSYAQLIDDFEAGLLVLEGESLTDYITRMGGVDYESKANGGIMGRVGYAQGGVQYAPTTASRMQNAQSTSPTISQTTGGIQSVPTTHMRNIQQRQVQSMTPEQFIAANSKPGSQNTPTSLLNLFYKNSPLIAPPGVLSLAEMEAKRNRILAEQKAQQRADSGLADPITGKKYISQQEAIDDLGIVVYNQRFAEGGRVGFALGGMRTQDLSSVYDSSSVLQDKYATQQDYLDLFDNSNTTTTTTPTNSTTTTTNVVNQAATPILPPRVNPLIIPQGGDSGSGGGITNIGRTNMNQPNAMGGKTPGFKAGAQRAFNDIKTVAGGLIDIAKYVNPLDPDKFNIMNLYKKGKEVFSKRSDKIVADQIAKAIALEEEMARREEDRIRSQSPTGSMNYGPSGYEGMSDAASDQEKSEGGRGSRG